MKTLEQVPLEAFKDDMSSYLQGSFPEECEILGAFQVREVINLGIERAAQHGFETRGDVCDYIALMFMLGSFFDVDPQLPWMGELLENNDKEKTSGHMEVIYGKTAHYLKQVAGIKGEHYKSALLKAREMPFNFLVEMKTDDLLQAMRSIFRMLYKQKYEQLSEKTLNHMKNLGQGSAGKYGLQTREGILIYVCLMFMLGTRFDQDPLYPWAAAVLKDGSIKDPDLKAHKLYEGAIDNLKKYLETDPSTGRA